MIFSSYFFLLVFLPLAFGGYAILRRFSVGSVAISWLVACSLLFYAWDSPAHVLLLVGSIAVNYGLGSWLGAARPGDERSGLRRTILIAGVAFNLLLIGVFKYAGFAWSLFRPLGLPEMPIEILLPIGISFFTFQQIAYLVDVYRDRKACRRVIDYAFFVSFFPQLIAGPIVHHREILPQLASHRMSRRNRARDGSIGITLLVFGLFKKVVLADQFASFATPVFEMASETGSISFFQAWVAALAYTLQLYFDFSGYSDMAIGLARLIGLRLPANFASPYQATSIIDFWRRWHMTLSRFLRDYLYFALGGNRRGKSRRYMNLVVTMLLGGLWHGAAWTFVAWGGFHGLLLCLNHAWRKLSNHWQPKSSNVMAFTLWRLFTAGLTFLAVVVGWVLFRAADFGDAIEILSTMCGMNGFGFESPHVSRRVAAIWILVGLLVVWVFPNSQTIMRKYLPTLQRGRKREDFSPLGKWLAVRWHPGIVWAMIIVIMLIASLMLLDRPSEFIYYQF